MGDTTIFPALIQNAALLLAMAFIYDLLTSRHRVGPWPLPVQMVVGCALGCLGIIIMLSPWRYVPGIVFDTRSVLLGISGLFFGAVPTAVAMAMTAAFRLSQGGAAAWVGVAVILTTGTIGIVWRRRRRRPLADFSWRELYLFGLLIHLDMLALMLTLPWPMGMQVLAQITLPVLLIYPLATTLLGVLMVNRLRRENFDTQLRTGEERLRLALMAANQGLYDLNVQTGEAKVSPEYATMLGYDPAEFHETNTRWIERLHPDDLDSVAATYRDYIAGKIPEYRVEFRQRTKTNDWKWILSLGKIVEYDAAGLPLRMVGTHTDITERKQAEEALRESEQKARAIFDLSFGFIGLLTPDGTLLDANRSALDFAGIQLSEVVGKPFWETPWWSHSPEMQNRIRAAVHDAAKGKLVRSEATHPAQDGSIHFIDFTLKPVMDETGRVTLLIPEGRDITERKRAEESQLHLHEQLTQAQKMESVGRLAGGVAHDFNNMLSVILGNAEMAMVQVDQTQPIHSHLEEIRTAGKRAANLTRQLLAFARKQTVVPKVLDLNETVEGMLKMLRRLIGEDIDLAWLPGTGLWPVKVDPSQVDQILANLCVNARDAIAGVGKLTIETGNAAFGEACGTGHAGFPSGEFVLLAISDNGCGLAKETLEHIFEPFFTTKEMGHGTGLGLATVYGIVKQNNGFINVHSEPGTGTTFKIYLPRHTGQASETETAIPAAIPKGQGETVLLVEDEPTILEMTKKILEMQGYAALTASTPDEAIRLAEEYPGVIHLLMTDVVMPKMNGRDLAKRLRPTRPAMKCLFMSGYTADVIGRHGVLDEGVQFIQKPFSTQDLTIKLRAVLNDRDKGVSSP